MTAPTEPRRNSSADTFKLDERQRLVVDEAERLSKQASAAGRNPSPELARRMQDEQDLAFPAAQEVLEVRLAAKRPRHPDADAEK